MYYHNNELPPQQGWICPKCGRVNAPWMPTCGCVSSQTCGSNTPYSVDIDCFDTCMHAYSEVYNECYEENKYNAGKGAEDYERATEQMEHDALYEPTYNPEDGSM